jgi:hypothetical protein
MPGVCPRYACAFCERPRLEISVNRIDARKTPVFWAARASGQRRLISLIFVHGARSTITRSTTPYFDHDDRTGAIFCTAPVRSHKTCTSRPTVPHHPAHCAPKVSAQPRAILSAAEARSAEARRLCDRSAAARRARTAQVCCKIFAPEERTFSTSPMAQSGRGSTAHEKNYRKPANEVASKPKPRHRTPTQGGST